MAIEFVLDLELWIIVSKEKIVAEKIRVMSTMIMTLKIRPQIKFRPDYCLPPSKKKRPFFPPSNLNMINWVKLLLQAGENVTLNNNSVTKVV